MEQVNVLIIGAGVVGLSVAKVLSEEFEDVVVVEKENRLEDTQAVETAKLFIREFIIPKTV